MCCGDGLFVGFGGDGGWVRFKWREEMMVVVVFCGWCGGGMLWWWQRAAIKVKTRKYKDYRKQMASGSELYTPVFLTFIHIKYAGW